MATWRCVGKSAFFCYEGCGEETWTTERGQMGGRGKEQGPQWKEGGRVGASNMGNNGRRVVVGASNTGNNAGGRQHGGIGKQHGGQVGKK